MTRLLALASLLLLAACPGGPSADDAGTQDAGPEDSGVQGPPRLPGFNARADGWPAGARVVGAALVGGTLYAATGDGVLSLQQQAFSWTNEALPLGAGEKVTGLLRVDRTLYLTAAAASAGGVVKKPQGEAWARVTTAPTQPAFALVKKGPEVLLAAGGDLWAAASPEGPFAKRTRTAMAFLAKPLAFFVAAPAQQRLFAVGDAASGFGVLYHSDDSGATWATGLVAGDIRAVGAGGAVVLLESATAGQQRSDNYGATFRPFTLGASATGFAFGAATTWASTDQGVRASSDLGLTWADDAAGLPGGAVRSLWLVGSQLVADTASGPYVRFLE